MSSLHPVPLSNATLADLPEGIMRPRYDRAQLSPGIVHIGLGNFHRAHQAWYTHRLMQKGLAHDWAILGAGIRPYDAEMRDRLRVQDFLTTLIELGPEHRSVEVTGPMIDYVAVEAGNGALIRAMANPQIRIVTLTVTEGGYYTDPETGTLDTSHADIAHDAVHPNQPRTVFGAIVAALRLRQAAGHAPFSCLSCDNLRGNGAVLRRTVVGLAQLSNETLADWIDTESAFPNSMVDCIVPATGPAELAVVREMSIADNAPVTHENFRQWVIEDRFCAGRPDWDRVGATFTDNVHAYEMMKIRILNAGHQVLANAGELLAVPTIAECMAHPLLATFFRKVEVDEVLPYVDGVSGMTPTAYLSLIEQRFANSAIRDTTRRVSFDGSSRHPGFVVPIVADALAAGGSIEGLALVEALWARMCEGHREDGSLIEPNDPQWAQLRAAAIEAKNRPRAWLEQPSVYGALPPSSRFEAAFEAWLLRIWAAGTETALTDYISGNGNRI